MGESAERTAEARPQTNPVSGAAPKADDGPSADASRELVLQRVVEAVAHAFTLWLETMPLVGASCENPLTLASGATLLPPLFRAGQPEGAGTIFARLAFAKDATPNRAIAVHGLDPTSLIVLRSDCSATPLQTATAGERMRFRVEPPQSLVLEIDAPQWKVNLQPTVVSLADSCQQARAWTGGETRLQLHPIEGPPPPSCASGTAGWPGDSDAQAAADVRATLHVTPTR